MNRKLWLKFRWILNILNRSPNPKAPAKWMYKLTNSAVAIGGLCSSWTVCSSTVQPSRMEEQMNVHMGLKSKRKKRSHVPCFCLPSSFQSCCWFCCHLCFTRLLHVCGFDKELGTQKHTQQIGNGVVSSCVGIWEVRPGGRRNDQSQWVCGLLRILASMWLMLEHVLL